MSVASMTRTVSGKPMSYDSRDDKWGDTVDEKSDVVVKTGRTTKQK